MITLLKSTAVTDSPDEQSNDTHRNCLNLKLIDEKKGFSLLNHGT